MQVNYLIDEACATSKGANAVVSYHHHFLEYYGLGEKKLILHADNCSGQNKNNIMIGYLLWRCATGRNEEIEMNFLIAGHTKFPCNLHFGYLKKKTRRTKLSSLGDIEQAVNTSAKGNMCPLVGKQDGTVVVPVYDWANFLEVKKIVGIKRYHQFSMTMNKVGVVTMKVLCDSKVKLDHVMMTTIKEELPQLILPAGLSLQRRKYLAKEIREFCPPSTRDLVCPIPEEDEEETECAAKRPRVMR